MPLYGDSLTLQEIRDSDCGLRPSFQKLLTLIDTSDPAWPSTAAVLREMTEAGIEIDEAAFSIAAKLGAHRLRVLDAGKPRKRQPAYAKIGLATVSDSIVYYIRRGKLIKIGTTTDPALRFSALLPDEILAFEPGTVDHEKVRHRQFAHLRQRGEFFAMAPELMEHVRSIRLMYGAPDPSWPTTARQQERLPASGLDDLPSVDGETVTVSVAAERLGVPLGRARGWVHRKKIREVGRNEHGYRLYFLEHFMALRDKPYHGGRKPSLTSGSPPV